MSASWPPGYKPKYYSRYYYKLKQGIDPEPIWSEAQHYDVWFTRLSPGNYTFTMDSTNPYSTIFAVKYSELFESVYNEQWIF